jgi:hypothetical protein
MIDHIITLAVRLRLCMSILMAMRSFAQKLMGQAATRQPALLKHLRMTLERMADDQSGSVGQLLRNGLETSSTESAALLQVIVAAWLPTQMHSTACCRQGIVAGSWVAAAAKTCSLHAGVDPAL